MDGQDFQMPSPKCSRINSLEETRMAIVSPPKDASTAESVAPPPQNKSESTTQHLLNTSADENSMLDTLMQHVEAESTPDLISTSIAAPVSTQISAPPAPIENTTATSVRSAFDDARVQDDSTVNEDHSATQERVLSHTAKQEDVSGLGDKVGENSAATATNVSTIGAPLQERPLAGTDAPNALIIPAQSQAQETGIVDDATPVEAAQVHRDVESATAQAVATIDGIPPMLESARLADPVEGPEWEVDSSPYESSSDSDTSSDDSSDEDADGDYAMLDPEEQARILMQGDGGSDDEGEKTKNKGENSGLKTANEQIEDVLPIPEISITEDMKVEELGHVEGIVDKIVLIKAKVSGEYQVLDTGSLLCLEDRKVAGVVAELLGRVEQPLYMVRFRSDQEIEERGMSQKGTTVYYVPSHSSFVFTQPLKAVKGSDASNFHDEEVGDDEMEFSDDEAEAEHKRNLKLKRQGKLGETGRSRGSGRGGRGGQRGGRPGFDQTRDTDGAAYGNGSLEMNYDDVNDGEEGYTPLARPTNLHEMMGSAQPVEVPGTTSLPPFTQQNRGRGRGGRGDRGRGRGDRGHGGGRGALHPQNRHTIDRSHFHNQSQGQGNGYQQPPFLFPPPPPMLAPQVLGNGYGGSLATSPMSPLPNQQFNFAAAFQSPQNYNGGNFQQQYQQQQNTYYNPSAMHPYPQQQPQQTGNFPNGWQNNQAAIAEVQRQLEQMRRNAGGGGQQ